MQQENEIQTNAKWYIVQVISGYEQKVKESLENRIFEDKAFEVEEVFLPLEKKISKTGKKRYKIIFPGYIFVKVVMNDESWYTIRNTQYVTGIVGSSGQRTKPTPIPDIQIGKIIQRIQEADSEIDYDQIKSISKVFSVDFEVNDQVEITEGNFAKKFGKVIDIDLENQSVIVEIDLFGRLTPVTLDIKEVKRKVF